MDLLRSLEADLRVDAFYDDPPPDMIGAARFRCSAHGNNQGGHVFIYYIQASNPAKMRPDECTVCGNTDIDAYDG